MKIGSTYVLGFLLFSPGILFAEPKITTSVSAQEVAMNDQISFTIQITGVQNIGSAPQPQIPGFIIQSAGQTQSYQWVNGEASSLISFNYTLIPTQPGSYTIPSISLTNENKTYTSDPIQILVKPVGTTAAAQNSTEGGPSETSVPSEGLKPIFMTAETDKTRTYVGDQIMLTVKLLRRPDVRLASQPQYTQPDMAGFIVETMKQQEYTTKLHGVPYIATELRYALFPTSDGEFTIGQSNINVAIRAEPDPFSANSLFQNFFGRTQNIRLNTNAISIQIRALPKNKPIDFSGAVGRFNMVAKADTTDPEVGKPFNVIVRIEGTGNIKSIKEPKLPPVNSLRQYETISDSQVNMDESKISGSKVFKYLLIPQVSGQITIPSISFSYFNPDLHKYITESSPEIPLFVKQGTLSQNDTSGPYVAGREPQNTEGVQVIEKDIRFIKTGKIHKNKENFIFTQTFILLNSFPIIFAIGALMTRWNNKNRVRYANSYRSKNALKNAQKHFKKAKKTLAGTDSKEFYKHIHAGITGFMADKTGGTALGLTWAELDQRLTEKNVSPELKKNLQELLDEVDMAQFGASTFEQQQKIACLKKSELTLKEINKAYP